MPDFLPMIAEDMLVLQGLTDDQAPLALIQSALHKYDSYQKKKQGEEEASGLAQEDDAAPGNAAVGPIASCLFEGKVGQQLATKATSVVEERKGEMEEETTGREVIQKHDEVLAIPNEPCNDFGTRLLEALCYAEEAYENFCELSQNGDWPAPKRRRTNKMPTFSLMRKRIEASRDLLWEQVPAIFQRNAAQMASETILQVNVAMENRGYVQISDTGAESPLDLNAMMDRLQMPEVVSDLETILDNMKNQHVLSACEKMKENLSVLGELGRVLTTALVSEFPTYKALYADQSSDANIKAAANFDMSRLGDLGVSPTTQEVLDASCLRHLKARRKQLRSAVFVRVKEFVDVFLNNTHANVTLRTVKGSVLDELAPDDPSTKFIMAYCRVIAHHRPVHLSELPSQDRKSIKENGELALQLWPLPECPEIVASGLARPEAKIALEKVLDAVKEISKSFCQALVSKLTKLCQTAQARMKDLDPDDEAAFRLVMKSKATNIANDEKLIDSALDLVAKAFKEQGVDFDQVDEHKPLKAEAEKLCSMSMYYTCVYTAMIFYKSRETWGTSNEGKHQKSNMTEALAMLDARPNMAHLEANLSHKILTQMRTAVAVVGVLVVVVVAIVVVR